MQKLFLFCLFALLGTMVNAQDKIITIKQDTINCRIVSIDTERISYEQKSVNGYIVGQSIPIKEVATYFRLSQSDSNTFRQRPERPWLFRINSGGSWLPWLFDNAEEELSDDEKKLGKGFHLNVSGHYLTTQSLGIGIQYSFFRSSTNYKHPFDLHYYPVYYGMSTGKERQYINYIGPSLILQQFLDKNKKFQLSETFSVGGIFYRGESQISIQYAENSNYYTYNQNSLITGWNLGASVGLSAEYYIFPYLSVGLGGNFFFGSLGKVDIEYRDSNGESENMKGLELDKSLKISRLDYSLSLSVHF